MCDKCDNSLSRRELLKLAGAGFALALAGCNAEPALTNLPDADLEYEDHLTEASDAARTQPGPVRIDPRTIVIPPPHPAEKTEYGNIMPRAAWTRAPLELPDGAPMNGVTKLTIHHSGDGKPFMGESVEDVARHLQIVLQAHRQRGMIDIAYHFAVDRTGRVWQLRWLKYEGQHVRRSANGFRNNEHNIGIVVLGDFDLQSPTVVQCNRLFEMVRLVRSKYALLPASVKMHGEIVSSYCPGKRLSPLILSARQRNQM